MTSYNPSIPVCRATETAAHSFMALLMWCFQVPSDTMFDVVARQKLTTRRNHTECVPCTVGVMDVHACTVDVINVHIGVGSLMIPAFLHLQ